MLRLTLIPKRGPGLSAVCWIVRVQYSSYIYHSNPSNLLLFDSCLTPVLIHVWGTIIYTISHDFEWDTSRVKLIDNFVNEFNRWIYHFGHVISAISPDAEAKFYLAQCVQSALMHQDSRLYGVGIMRVVGRASLVLRPFTPLMPLYHVRLGNSLCFDRWTLTVDVKSLLLYQTKLSLCHSILL